MDSRKAMLMEMQKLIHEYSQIGDQLTNINKELVWQELNLTDEEALSLSKENLSPASIKAIEKTVKDNMMGLFHDFMCLVDGVSDPSDIEIENDGVWLGLQIKAKHLLSEQELEDEDSELMLHDEVYDSYWDWKDQFGENNDKK
ncbi:hypothetical protein COM86_25150 [Priestia megaterium]|jgi:hypothetical protein|uniref:hypothetical protein n=1 Tax=Priestia TaxID=2800373 RepID=UPI000BEC0E4F|nr:hypothetical protein [Priestia megaterium]PEB61272.1 hypothetical protein COM86_25150 [Priestia megaterium]PEE77686.1 hypothetical protein COM81_06250 [Priestia megaterium]PFI91849.1 hypothetical protein COI84_20735 [Priestia megaterium]PGR15640.1 hypothetical protein COC62_02595 [Priestia megaterium]